MNKTRETIKCGCCGKAIAWRSGEGITQLENCAGYRLITPWRWEWLCKECDSIFFGRKSSSTSIGKKEEQQ